MRGGYDYDHLVILTRGIGDRWHARSVLSADAMKLPDGREQFVSKVGVLSRLEISLQIGETSARAAPYKVFYKRARFIIASRKLLIGDEDERQ
jgi:hypothetical protein